MLKGWWKVSVKSANGKVNSLKNRIGMKSHDEGIN